MLSLLASFANCIAWVNDSYACLVALLSDSPVFLNALGVVLNVFATIILEPAFI